MMIHPTLEHLHELRLRGMAAALEEQLQGSAASELSFEERLGLLVEREITWRNDRRLKRLLQEARLRLPSAAPENIHFRAPRGLDRSVILRLASADWVRHHQVVLVIGPTGVGKSFIACALGQAACRNSLSTRYFRLGRLLADLALARADGSLAKLLTKLARTDLLILDDWGIAPLSDAILDRLGARRSQNHPQRRLDAKTARRGLDRYTGSLTTPAVASLRLLCGHLEPNSVVSFDRTDGSDSPKCARTRNGTASIHGNAILPQPFEPSPLGQAPLASRWPRTHGGPQ